MLLFCDPPMYGRSAAGVSCTIATHHPDAATITAVATTSWVIRRRSDTGAAIRYTRPNAGTTRNACSILVRKAKPTRVAASTSHLVLPASIARTVAYVAMVSRSTSSASGLSKRNMSAATGVSATVAPAIRAAAGGNHRRTIR